MKIFESRLEAGCGRGRGEGDLRGRSERHSYFEG